MLPSSEAPGPLAILGRILAAAVVLSVLAIGVWWLGSPATPPAPEAPVRASTTPVNSLVGAQRCTECHAAEAAAHALSGHSRTFALTRESPVAQALCGQTVSTEGPFGPYEYVCDDLGLAVANRERFGGRMFSLDFALGSGDHAVTFLSLLPFEDGRATAGIEHRMTWYRARNGMGITPGQQDLVPTNDAEHFGRIYDFKTATSCINCHTTDFEIRGHALTKVIPGVQCEKCHGPGAEHVAAAAAGESSQLARTIQRPKTALDEITMCGQCHRMPEEIDPDRLRRYPPSLVRFQPVGLLQSRCYLESGGALRCSTCHDPHAPASSRTREMQVATCRSCHEGSGKTPCPVSPRERCIDCHMEKRELIEGIYFHDHWIRSRPEFGDAPESTEAHATLKSPPDSPHEH